MRLALRARAARLTLARAGRNVGQRLGQLEAAREGIVTDHTTEKNVRRLELDAAQLRTLQLAGYSLDDDQQRSVGLLAYKAAALVRAAASEQASGRRPSRVGRNDPCPCGSGKKYKKCCMAEGKAPPGPSLESATAAEPLDPELVPRLRDAETTGKDLRQLGAMLERDRDLRTVRLSGPRVARFLAAQNKDGPELEGAELDRFVDQTAARYVESEADGATLMDRLLEQLNRAARRPRPAPELRALALGVLYAALDKDRAPSESLGPNPLVCAVFRLSLAEELRRRAEPGALKGGRPGAVAHAQGKLAPELAAELQHSGERMLEDLRLAIRQNRFPVLLPNPSLLPLFVRIEQRQRSGKEPTQGELGTLVAQAVGEWLPEDRKLFAAELERWLEQHADAAPELIGQVRSVHALVAGECVEPLDVELALAALRQGRGTPVAGEPPPAAGGNEAALSSDYLERYGDFLREHGYPALARRTYALCAEQGAVPASVAEKLGR
jgi:hypothetical protein